MMDPALRRKLMFIAQNRFKVILGNEAGLE
jgi:hypothetical protein